MNLFTIVGWAEIILAIPALIVSFAFKEIRKFGWWTLALWAVSSLLATPLVAGGSLWPHPFEWVAPLGICLLFAAFGALEVVVGVYIFKRWGTHTHTDTTWLLKIYLFFLFAFTVLAWKTFN